MRLGQDGRLFHPYRIWEEKRRGKLRLAIAAESIAVARREAAKATPLREAVEEEDEPSVVSRTSSLERALGRVSSWTPGPPSSAMSASKAARGEDWMGLAPLAVGRAASTTSSDGLPPSLKVTKAKPRQPPALLVWPEDASDGHSRPRTPTEIPATSLLAPPSPGSVGSASPSSRTVAPSEFSLPEGMDIALSRFQTMPHLLRERILVRDVLKTYVGPNEDLDEVVQRLWNVEDVGRRLRKAVGKSHRLYGLWRSAGIRREVSSPARAIRLLRSDYSWLDVVERSTIDTLISMIDNVNLLVASLLNEWSRPRRRFSIDQAAAVVSFLETCRTKDGRRLNETCEALARIRDETAAFVTGGPTLRCLEALRNADKGTGFLTRGIWMDRFATSPVLRMALQADESLYWQILTTLLTEGGAGYEWTSYWHMALFQAGHRDLLESFFDADLAKDAEESDLAVTLYDALHSPPPTDGQKLVVLPRAKVFARWRWLAEGTIRNGYQTNLPLRAMRYYYSIINDRAGCDVVDVAAQVGVNGAADEDRKERLARLEDELIRILKRA